MKYEEIFLKEFFDHFIKFKDDKVDNVRIKMS